MQRVWIGRLCTVSQLTNGDEEEQRLMLIRTCPRGGWFLREYRRCITKNASTSSMPLPRPARTVFYPPHVPIPQQPSCAYPNLRRTPQKIIYPARTRNDTEVQAFDTTLVAGYSPARTRIGWGTWSRAERGERVEQSRAHDITGEK